VSAEQIVRACIDWRIGWHQGRAADHAAREQIWRDRYERLWPNQYRTDALTEGQRS
jgi:hypothetical protein